MFVLIVSSWWMSWTSSYEAMPHFVFVIIMFQLVALFLAAKAVLPDDRDLDRLDLLDHYRHSNRYVWLSLTALWVLLILPTVVEGRAFQEPAKFIAWVWMPLVYAGVSLLLACVQRMTLHRVLVPGFLVLHLVQVSAWPLSTPA